MKIHPVVAKFRVDERADRHDKANSRFCSVLRLCVIKWSGVKLWAVFIILELYYKDLIYYYYYYYYYYY